MSCQPYLIFVTPNQVDYSCNLRGCSVVCRSNKARDLERYRSIRMAAAAGKVELEVEIEC